MIVWVDVETSGLDEKSGHLLEVAFVVTDDTLAERASTSIVVKPVGVDVEAMGMPLVVREMHEKSGLLADIPKIGVCRHEAEGQLTSWLGQTFGRLEDLRSIALAGSTVSFDRRWLRAHMEKLEALFSYRSIDVSCLTELASRFSTAVYAHRPKKEKGVKHRALEDVRESINYLRYYLASGFVNAEGIGFLQRAQFHCDYFNNNCPFSECDQCTVRTHEAS